jgi:DNA-binding GntR family transcriptional regulator
MTDRWRIRNISEEDANDLYDLGVGLPPDAAEHAALLAELEGGDDDEEVSASDDELEDW